MKLKWYLILFLFFSMLFSNTVLFSQNSEKLNIGVLDLDIEGIRADVKKTLSNRLRTELNNTGRFVVLERNKMYLILEEQGFQQTGACNTDECIVEAGRLIGVTRMIAGSVGKVGTIYTVSLRMIDVETGRMIISKTEDSKCPIEDVLTTSLKNIALKMAGIKTDDKTVSPNTVTDYDGNVYKTIKIGNQIWMAENLRVTHYRNGDPIPNVTSGSDWMLLTKGAYCNYNNSAGKAKIYGRLYNWYAVNDWRNIAPAGWHVPTDEEWKQLEWYLSMSRSEANDTRYCDDNVGSKMAGNPELWAGGHLRNNTAFGESGLSVRPGGFRKVYAFDSVYDEMGYDAYFWTSSETNRNNGWSWYRNLDYDIRGVRRFGQDQNCGFSVRCVKD